MTEDEEQTYQQTGKRTQANIGKPWNFRGGSGAIAKETYITLMEHWTDIEKDVPIVFLGSHLGQQMFSGLNQFVKNAPEDDFLSLMLQKYEK